MTSSSLLTTLTLAALALAGCGTDYGVTYGGGQGPPVDREVASRGQALYRQLCSECHGADGSGGPDYPASIQGARSIARIVRGGADGMPANNLTDSEIADLEGYLAVRAGAPIAGGGAAPTGGGSPPGGTSGPSADPPPTGSPTGGAAEPAPQPAPAPNPPPGDEGDEDDDADEGD